MAKNTTPETTTVAKQEYAFPELWVTVQAESLEEATEIAKNQ